MLRAVIDASVVISWFLPDEVNGKYEDILNNIDKISIHVPSIFEYELMNILLNAEKRNRIDHSTALKVLDIVGHYPINLESSTTLRLENIKVYKMAQTYNLTSYDTAYLELALRLNVPLITYDKLLFNSAKKLRLRTAF